MTPVIGLERKGARKTEKNRDNSRIGCLSSHCCGTDVLGWFGFVTVVSGIMGANSQETSGKYVVDRGPILDAQDSKAPISQPAPRDLGWPRWSVAGLPGRSAWVKVGPPLSCRGPRSGTVLRMSVGSVRLQVPSDPGCVHEKRSHRLSSRRPWGCWQW